MRTINLSLSLVILLFTACSKNEEPALPVHTGKGVIETQCNVSETEAFRIIDETDIEFICMYVDMALDTQGNIIPDLSWQSGNRSSPKKSL
ncbi:MAG: hypothetical protein LUD15_02025 [Bacteroides sp.]|nr:hypothetical protein [Bacteroides sp.]